MRRARPSRRGIEAAIAREANAVTWIVRGLFVRRVIHVTVRFGRLMHSLRRVNSLRVAYERGLAPDMRPIRFEGRIIQVRIAALDSMSNRDRTSASSSFRSGTRILLPADTQWEWSDPGMGSRRDGRDERNDRGGWSQSQLAGAALAARS